MCYNTYVLSWWNSIRLRLNSLRHSLATLTCRSGVLQKIDRSPLLFVGVHSFIHHSRLARVSSHHFCIELEITNTTTHAGVHTWLTTVQHLDVRSRWHRQDVYPVPSRKVSRFLLRILYFRSLHDGVLFRPRFSTQWPNTYNMLFQSHSFRVSRKKHHLNSVACYALSHLTTPNTRVRWIERYPLPHCTEQQFQCQSPTVV